MDEHRIGLGPILRRVWAPKGATVKAPVAPRYQWMYVFAFVHPESGRTTWLLLPTVNAEVFSQAMALFNEDQSRKPADLQRLTGIPKATVYRLVERYHQEHPVNATAAMRETETQRDEAMSGETETAS